ncbi:MAG: preprotein translocase subunit SecY [Anaerolineales bacterium]|jgi:preprotein translocase subunit SecY|nr:preprotein translocase subunit SecY [Anaerolineales bacterium]MDP7643701.1 preprotein translocase subunit SecY [Anaerolineales bacterium]HJN41896.1 preprotein translocase subunit SecY [Anaerolineales bacterium]
MKGDALRRLWTAHDLRNRLLITVALLVLYRLAAHVPVPGVDRAAIAQILQSSTGTGNLLSLFDLLSGGTVSNFSVLAMGVYPYITAQIILQLMVPIVPALKQRMEDDPREGRQFIERWTYYLAIPMASLNAIGQIRLFQASGLPVLPHFGFSGANLLPTITTLITMTGGTMFAIWLGELISEYGIRNQGLSLIIFSGIVSRLPNSVGQLWSDEQTRYAGLALFLALVAITVFAIVVVTQGRRNVPVMYPGRRIGRRQSMPVRGSLPLLVNMAGMIPIIFASAILSFPAILAQFFTGSQAQWVRNIALGMQDLFANQQNWGYITIYFFMVVLFAFFYTDVLFQQQNYGENLKRVGAQVPGVTKGVPTQRYLNKVLRRITLPGATLLGTVAVLPLLVGAMFLGVTGGGNAFFAIGSGLLIVVGVVKETFFGLETELKLRGYDDSLLVH